VSCGITGNVIEICAVRILEHSSVCKDKTLIIAKCTFFFCGNKNGRQPDNLSRRKKAWENPHGANVGLPAVALV